MMDGEEVYRNRLDACLADAAAASLPQVRDKFLAAAESWRGLLETALERKREAAALQVTAALGEKPMSDTPYEIPDDVVDAIVEDGDPAEKAFREHAGVSIAGLAEATDISAARIDAIEHGATPTDEELAEIGDALHVPTDLLVDE